MDLIQSLMEYLNTQKEKLVTWNINHKTLGREAYWFYWPERSSE